MELRLVTKTNTKLEIEVIGENDTLLNLLKQKLLADPSVETATYVMGHPYLDTPKFILKTKSGKADVALKNAAKTLRGQYDEFETLLVKATSK